jgi:hypothetical protein
MLIQQSAFVDKVFNFFCEIEQSGFYPNKVFTPVSLAQYLHNCKCNP